MNERDKLLRKARRTCKEDDWSSYKRKKNFCTNTIRSAKARYHKNMINENANNPRNFWKCIKNVIPNKSTGNTTSAPFLKDDTPINSKEKNKAEIFCSFFSTIANNLKHQSMKLRDFTWRKPKLNHIRTVAKFKLKEVSEVWVENQLKSLKRNKSTGPDNLPPGMLKGCAEVISSQIC